MFRSVFAACVVGALSLGISAPVQASEDVAEGLCSSISADDRQRFRTILHNYNLRIRNIYDGVRCNGYSMLQFAITAEAIQVGEMLSRQLPVRTIADDKVDGQPLIEWAEQAGYATSDVLQVVRERMN